MSPKKIDRQHEANIIQIRLHIENKRKNERKQENVHLPPPLTPRRSPSLPLQSPSLPEENQSYIHKC